MKKSLKKFCFAFGMFILCSPQMGVSSHDPLNTSKSSIFSSSEKKMEDPPPSFDKGCMSVFLGYGFNNSTTKIVTDFGDGGGKSFGPIQIGYQYHLSKRIAIGLMFTTTSATTAQQFVTDFVTQANYTYSANFSTFLSKFDFFWSNKNNLAMYSGLALGTQTARFSTNVTSGDPSLVEPFTESVGAIASHITLFGVKSRFRSIGTYAEIGIGVNGLLNAGITYNFGSSK